MRRFVEMTMFMVAATALVACTGTSDAEPSASDAPPVSVDRPATVPASDDGLSAERPSPDHSISDGRGFVETFDDGTGFDRFDSGIYHRDEFIMATTEWSADHDHNCGDPDTQRIVHREQIPESFYMCRDHLMTSIGDTAGYSTGWFSPRATFTTETRVSWDVNVTNLLARKWWEVAIVPTSFDSAVESCPRCSVSDWLSPDPSGLPPTPEGAIVVGNGPFGGTVNISYNGDQYTDWRRTCGDEWALFESSGACDSKATRLPFSITEHDGEITVDYGGVYTQTFDGAFPDEFVVIFKDHSYTPDKDGAPVGLTWHWDSVAVT